jgi:hypothetical protein
MSLFRAEARFRVVLPLTHGLKAAVSQRFWSNLPNPKASVSEWVRKSL